MREATTFSRILEIWRREGSGRSNRKEAPGRTSCSGMRVGETEEAPGRGCSGGSRSRRERELSRVGGGSGRLGLWEKDKEVLGEV